MVLYLKVSELLLESLAFLYLVINVIVSVYAMSLEVERARTTIDYSRVSTSAANTRDLQFCDRNEMIFWFGSVL
jgi:hypothetical protein